nr:MAG TPA: hypothetical protein [Caudoviricetes sp.]
MLNISKVYLTSQSAVNAQHFVWAFFMPKCKILAAAFPCRFLLFGVDTTDV